MTMVLDACVDSDSDIGSGSGSAPRLQIGQHRIGHRVPEKSYVDFPAVF
jgi:hypothetical protein